jgi:triosephosphate isomerase
MRQPLVAGNWKLNGNRQSIDKLLQGILGGMQDVKKAEVAVCAPYIYIPQVADSLKNSTIKYGAQNVSEYESGAYTGEISATMLQEFGCNYAIVGHSERRSIYGETDQQVANKFVSAQKAGIRPILCVGELLEERESGETEAVVARQLDAVVDTAGIESLKDAVIAYEPVWAIGTGKTASPEQAQEVHAFIRQRLADNNAEVADLVLFAQADIDGGLIGGASLDAKDFLSICCAPN